jgi:hypothetical protein
MGVEPTKLMAFTSGCTSSASTASLSPCTTLNTPSGRPACFSRSAISRLGVGSIGLGLSTKVLPEAMASGNIHMGTMTGKLNGVMPATTPSGWRSVQLSMPVETWSVKSPLSSCGNAAGEFDDVDAARHLALRVGEHLAVLDGDGAGQVVLVLVHQLQELEHDAGAADGRRVGPGRKGGLAAATAALTSAALASSTRPVTSPVAGLVTGWWRLDVPAWRAPPM